MRLWTRLDRPIEPEHSKGAPKMECLTNAQLEACLLYTSHNASLTHETTDRMGLHAAQGIDEVLSGGAPTWPCVTPKKPR